MFKILLTSVSVTIFSALLLAMTGVLGVLYSNLVYIVLPVAVFIVLVLAIISIILNNKLLLLINGISLILKVILLYPIFSLGNPKDHHSDVISVTSFNISFVKLPRVYSPDYWSNQISEDTRKIEKYLNSLDSDIICLQEFFNDDKNEAYNYLSKFIEKGYDYMFLTNPKHDNGIARGLLTLSRYPILKRGKIFLSDNRYNGMSFIDVDTGSDTIRVVNLHLESMELYLGKRSFLDKVKYTFSEWKRTTLARYEQIQILNQFLEKTPHKLILAGDFNELPFSYNLGFLDDLRSSYSETSLGFGSTLAKSRLPIRIDHQFFQGDIDIINSEVLYSIEGSDHYPLRCDYTLSN